MIQIRSEDLQKLDGMTDKLREQVILKSLRAAIRNTAKYARTFSFRRVRDSKVIKLKKANIANRIYCSQEVSGNSLTSMKGYLRFSHFDEYTSLFPLKKVRVTGSDNRTHIGFEANVLGKVVAPINKVFISPLQKMSLSRLDGRDTLEKYTTEGSSLSDVIRYESGLLSDIKLASSGRYEKEISRQIRRQLYLFEKELNNAK